LISRVIRRTRTSAAFFITMELSRVIRFDEGLYLEIKKEYEGDILVNVSDFDETISLSFTIPKDQMDEFISQLKDW